MRRTMLLFVAAMCLATTVQAPVGASAAVDGYLNSVSGTKGYQLKELASNTLLESKNPVYVFEPASSIKILHHAHAMLEVQKANVELSDTLAVTETGGACPTYTSDPDNYTFQSLETTLSQMMFQSDNAATDAVKIKFGKSAINDTAVNVFGTSDTALIHTLGCGPYDAWGLSHNRMTMNDASKIYAKIFNSSLYTKTNRDKLGQLMPGSRKELNDVIAQEAFFTYGMNVPQAFWDKLKVQYKDGYYPLSDGLFRSVAGYLELPFRYNTPWGPVVSVKRYTFGMFIDKSSSTKDAIGSAFSDALTELFRPEVRKALGTFG